MQTVFAVVIAAVGGAFLLFSVWTLYCLIREDYDVKIEIYEDKAGKWRWRMRAANGQVIADGGEGYANQSNIKRALRRLAGLDMRKMVAEALRSEQK